MSWMPIPPTADETWFRHTHWSTKRARVLETLHAAGETSKAIERFEGCGADAVVEYEPIEKRYRVRANHCHCRHCEPCTKAKANRLAVNLKKRLAETPNGRYRFVTLTLKHTTQPLADQIRRIYSCFRKLRATRFWKNTQRGGCAVLEVKWNGGPTPWHPHLHIISEGAFIKQFDLSRHWLAATGDSKIVDIRQLSSEKDAAHYVAKYVSKGTNDAVWANPNAAQEWVTSMKGVRTAATFGKWRGFKLLAIEKDTAEWRRVGTLDSICAEARKGEIWAISLLDAVTEQIQYNPHRPRRVKPVDSP